MIDWNLVVQLVVGVVLSVGAYLYRQLKQDTTEVKAKLDRTHEEFLNYKLHATEKFVTNDHLAQAVTGINRTLENVAASMVRVEARLNNQIDNSNARSQ